MRSVEIVLGGKAYAVSELPTRQNAAWRAELKAKLGALTTVLASAPTADLGDFRNLGTVLGGMSEHLVGSIDTIKALVLAYVPEANGKKLEEAAYDSEYLEAFAKILTLAFPFGAWGDKAAPMIREMARLSASKPTTTN